MHLPCSGVGRIANFHRSCQNCPIRQSESQSAISQFKKRPSRLQLIFVLALFITSMKKWFSKASRKDSGKELDGMPDDQANHVIPTVKEAFESSLENVGDSRKRFENKRKHILDKERVHGWDREARESASEAERKAADIVYRIREYERANLFGNVASEAIPGPETLDMGGQFLTNRSRIENGSQLFKIAKEMPKGAHLHLHFNAELDSREFIVKARDLPDNMFIRSTRPLLSDEDYDDAELVFNVMPSDTAGADCFSLEYKPAWKTPDAKPWMKWSVFKKELAKRRPDLDAETWVRNKMVLSEEEVYGISQTVNG